MTFLADRVTNVPVSFRQLRMKDAEGALQEGVVGANDIKIVQRAAGANMSVDFSVGAGYIQIDSGTRSGLAHFYNDAVANIAVTASNATNPRIDQAIVRYNDSSIPAGTGGNTPTPEILTGTATGGATLDNRTGAAALPNDCLRLADILIPATSTSVTTANIRDRRPWARGAYYAITHANTTDLTLSSTTYTALFTWTTPRIECSGAPLILECEFSASNSSVGSAFLAAPTVDGTSDATLARWQSYGATSDYNAIAVGWTLALAAGSHTIDVWGRVTAGNATIYRSNTNSLPQLRIYEQVRQNAANT